MIQKTFSNCLSKYSSGYAFCVRAHPYRRCPSKVLELSAVLCGRGAGMFHVSLKSFSSDTGSSDTLKAALASKHLLVCDFPLYVKRWKSKIQTSLSSNEWFL